MRNIYNESGLSSLDISECGEENDDSTHTKAPRKIINTDVDIIM